MKQMVRVLALALLVMVSSVCNASVLTQEDRVAFTEWAQTEFAQASDAVKKYVKFTYCMPTKQSAFLLDTIDTIIAKPDNFDVHSMRVAEKFRDLVICLQNELKTIGISFSLTESTGMSTGMSSLLWDEFQQMDPSGMINGITNNCFMSLGYATNNAMEIIEAQCTVEEKVTMLKNARVALKEALNDCNFIVDLIA